LGNPWFFYQYKNTSKEIIIEERIKVIKQHAKVHCNFYGERGMITFRKHLSWYFKSNKLGEDFPKIKEFRAKLVRLNSLDELDKLLDEFEKTKFS